MKNVDGGADAIGDAKFDAPIRDTAPLSRRRSA